MKHETHGPWCVFTDVQAVSAWIREQNAGTWTDPSVHLIHLQEEVGEVASAYIGMTGQNPRKGVTHSLDDLISELADVAITALCTITVISGHPLEPAYAISAKLQRIMERANIPDHPF